VAGEKARQKELEDQKKLVETQISKLAWNTRTSLNF
jgi:hypothetical protein